MSTDTDTDIATADLAVDKTAIETELATVLDVVQDVIQRWSDVTVDKTALVARIGRVRGALARATHRPGHDLTPRDIARFAAGAEFLGDALAFGDLDRVARAAEELARITTDPDEGVGGDPHAA